MGTLKVIKDLILFLFKVFKELKILKRKKEVGDAFEASGKDQRPIEKVISASSGRPSKYRYAGMRTRKAKKRR